MLVVENTVTKQEVYRQQYFALVIKEVNISHLSPDTVYAARVLARNAEFIDLTTVSEALFFTTPGML